jgi:hypothetical protein
MNNASDPAASAVLSMTVVESFYGDPASYDIHMTGLAKMIGLRGGLGALGLDGMLADITTWLDFNYVKCLASSNSTRVWQSH